MMRRVRVVLIAIGAIVLAIPLLPGPGVFIIMAALADVHDAFHPQPTNRPSAGFPPADASSADREPRKQLNEPDFSDGRRVA
jgi:hypothetical protein